MANKTTKNAKGSGSIRKRPDGLWEGRYTPGVDPKTGKQIQKSVYGKTQKEVRAKLNQILVEIETGTYLEPSLMTVSEWLDIWLKDYISNVKPSTVKSYQDHVRLNIKPYIGQIKLKKLTAPMVQSMYNDLLREKGLSPKTVKNVHGVLHRAMEQCVRLGYLRTHPLDAVTLPRIEKAKIHPMEDDLLTSFLREIRGNPYESVYYVTVFTGLRQSEVLGLTWDCVDFDRNTLLINKQHNKIKGTKIYAFSSLKNDKPRVLEVADAVMNAIKKQKAQQERWAELYDGIWSNPDNLVFTTQTGRYLCNQTVYLDFKKIVKRLGNGAVRFHDLRHTFAVNSLRTRDDIKTVQENLGHHTAAFTLDTYAHVTSGMRKESANRMEQYIQSVSGTPTR